MMPRGRGAQEMMGKRIRNQTALAGFLVLLLVFLTACGNNQGEPPESFLNQEGLQEEEETEKYRVFRSSSGKLSMLATDLWEEEETLHEESDISLYNEAYQSYLITLTDDKEKFPDELDMDSYSEYIGAAVMKDLAESKMTETEMVEIDGLGGRKFKVEGKIDDVSVTYAFLILESEKEYVQVIAWSFTENIENNAAYYDRIIESVKRHEVENNENGN